LAQYRRESLDSTFKCNKHLKLSQIDCPLTFDHYSREIAELTDKRHDNVVRDARAMLTDLYGEGGVLTFEETYIHPQNGQSYPMFRLPKDLTLTLVAGYNVRLRKRIIDRWMELEKQAALGALHIPQTYQEALQLAADFAGQNAALEQTIAEQAPKVEAYDHLIEDDGMYGVRAAAKYLAVKPRTFTDWLLNNKWAYRHTAHKHLLAYQDKLDKGWLAHKISKYWNWRTLMNDTSANLRVTGKGLVALRPYARAMVAAAA